MALRTVHFRNVDTGEAIQMPVVPASIDVEEGRRVDSLDMASTGVVNIPTLQTLFNKQQEYLLPATKAPYVTGDFMDPYQIVAKFVAWSKAGNVIRYIVTGTTINFPVLIENVKYREQDGTNDVYLTLTVRQYRYLAAVVSIIENQERVGGESPDIPTEQLYTVVSGDCLWSICKMYYGDGSLCYRLATYNGIPNTYLIHPGDVLKIPPIDVLRATAETRPKTSVSSEKVTKAAVTSLTQQFASTNWVQERFGQLGMKMFSTIDIGGDADGPRA